jgi:uncharacterized protein YjbJ (UPF0337 family)
MLDQAKGIAQDVVGKAQDAIGGATGDVGTQAEGKLRQGLGKAQRTYGDAVDGFREAAVENPLATLAAVAGVGFLLGVLWSRRD